MTTEVKLTEEQEAFRNLLAQFRAETQLSLSSAARLLDVNPGSMAKWYREDPESGRVRIPQTYMQDSVTLKIERLNSANQRGGIYSQLRGLKPADRVALLQEALDSGQFS